MIRFYTRGGKTFIHSDTNGDKLTDFALRLGGVHPLNAGDFLP